MAQLRSIRLWFGALRLRRLLATEALVLIDRAHAAPDCFMIMLPSLGRGENEKAGLISNYEVKGMTESK